MNDNYTLGLDQVRKPFEAGSQEAQTIAELRELASRSVSKPESLTMGEIQEVGWAFLMAMRTIERHQPNAVTPR